MKRKTTNSTRIDRAAIELTVAENRSTARVIREQHGNINVIPVEQVQEWLEIVEALPGMHSLWRSLKGSIKREMGSELLTRLLTLNRTHIDTNIDINSTHLDVAILYIEGIITANPNLELTEFNWADELLELCRTRVSKVNDNEIVVPAYYLLPASENRERLEMQGYNLSLYNLPFRKVYHPEMYYKLIGTLAPAAEFEPIELITSMEIFDDFDNIMLGIQLLRTLDQVNDRHKCEMRAEWELFIANWTKKYPILASLPATHFCDAMRDNYFLPARDLIKMKGSEELCIPVDIPNRRRRIALDLYSLN